MPRQEIRFAVANDVCRGETWKVWSQGDELYLTCRRFSVPLKVSFHGDGRCHVRFDPHMIERHARPDSHLRRNPEVQRWEHDRTSEQGVLFKVMVPHGSVSIERSGDDPSHLVLVPAPAEEDIAEVFLTLTDSDVDASLPDSAEGRQQGHLGTLPLRGGAVVSVDFRHRVFLTPPRMEGAVEMILGDRESLLAAGVRGVFAVETPDGPAFLEGTVGPREER
jgi:hypothetical protein